MRRVVCLAAAAACALAAAPVWAQTPSTLPTTASSSPSSTSSPWFVDALVGPSFGTNTTAVGRAAAGFHFSPTLSMIGEFGTFQADRLDNASAIAAPTGVAPDSKGTAYHVNANMVYQLPERARFVPYATGGVGFLTAPTIESLDTGPFADSSFGRETHAAFNMGGGVAYRIDRWLGVGVDYRYYVLASNQAPHMNRFTAGLTFFFD
ncbi:MAG TPA: outer membrane beta-barrel protein [Vicinamibacterales bacterium]|nr:outer membrane beta-barrel protein [Vicinamibacterales bacterium]